MAPHPHLHWGPLIRKSWGPFSWRRERDPGEERGSFATSQPSHLPPSTRACLQSQTQPVAQLQTLQSETVWRHPPEHPQAGLSEHPTKCPAQEKNASARKSDRGQSRREVLRTGDGCVLEGEVCCWAQEPTHCHSLATPPWVRLQPSLSSDLAVRMAGKYGLRLTGHSLIVVGQGCRRHGTSLVCTRSE